MKNPSHSVNHPLVVTPSVVMAMKLVENEPGRSSLSGTCILLCSKYAMKRRAFCEQESTLQSRIQDQAAINDQGVGNR